MMETFAAGMNNITPYEGDLSAYGQNPAHLWFPQTLADFAPPVVGEQAMGNPGDPAPPAASMGRDDGGGGYQGPTTAVPTGLNELPEPVKAIPWLGNFMAGINAKHNMGVLDKALREMGLPELTFAEMAGGVLGETSLGWLGLGNEYGEGTDESRHRALENKFVEKNPNAKDKPEMVDYGLLAEGLKRAGIRDLAGTPLHGRATPRAQQSGGDGGGGSAQKARKDRESGTHQGNNRDQAQPGLGDWDDETGFGGA